MGEIAEMMTDGTLCVHCGTYIEKGKAKGFPRSCCEKLPYNSMEQYIKHVEKIMNEPVKKESNERIRNKK